MYPEFAVDDWTRINLNTISAHKITDFIETCMKDRYFKKLLMSQYGSLIHAASKNLLTRANDLLTSLGKLNNLIITNNEYSEAPEPNWADYKRDQRQNALRELLERYRRRKQFLKSIGKQTTKSNCAETDIYLGNTNFLSGFLEPFSSKVSIERNYNEHLTAIIQCGLSSMLPWRQIISTELELGKTRLEEITPVITNLRKDKAFKFQTLIRMAHEGSVELTQTETFAPIQMIKTSTDKAVVTLKTNSGERVTHEWGNFTQNQRNKIIDDLKQGKIVLT